MEALMINSMAHLKQLCNINGYAEFYILLGGGLCRSSKRIWHNSTANYFDIYNEIDETWQEKITEKELKEFTMIPEAIDKHALFYTGYQLQGII